MYAAFRHQRFAHLASGELSGPPTLPTAAFHAVALTPEQEQRVRAINRSGVHARADLVLGQLVVSPTQEHKRVNVRVPYANGVGGVSLGDLHARPLEEAAQEIVAELFDGTTLDEARRWARRLVRELLEEHPAPSRAHLLEAYAGLRARAHADFQPVLAEGLRAGLRALQEPDAEELVQAAVAQARQAELVAQGGGQGVQ